LYIQNLSRLRREEAQAANHLWKNFIWRGRSHHLFFCEMPDPIMDSIIKMILLNMASIVNSELWYLIEMTKKGQDALQADLDQPLGV
jgi:hypothetical protein